MEIGPILRALTRNKLGVVLIALQIAFTMTVMVNAVFIINERSKAMARPSGLDEPNMFYLRSTGFGDQFNSEVTEQDDLDLLRNTPGIIDATPINAIPVSGGGSSTALRLEDDPTLPAIPAAVYYTDDHALNTMDLNLIAGENFTSNDVLYQRTSESRNFGKAVVSQTLAETLFPGEGLNAVGRTFYNGDNPVQIAGIIERLQSPWPNSSFVEQAMIVPLNFISGTSTYLIRTEPGERDRLMVETEETLASNNPNRIIRDLMSMNETREESYRLDSAMATILSVVIVTLVFITSMGIVGLAVFGINRRRKQIGTRRALGATQGEILRYFMLENFFISGVGVTLGAVFTIGFSIMLSSLFESPTMSWYYTPLGMVILILIGQIAVLGPSTRAARIQPAIATRSI
ncbi:MAG: cell division protein FtsX [SAR86 cluster bacterium]|uniref:Cell division protein FtsX n=1 Tax=SAR86 cluster bacterium TaxID=2030880 RepID=A0A2A4XAG2_9GAMM|nr:MAG: cell division protein FtsX [SAR86 cluster bacterium]